MKNFKRITALVLSLLCCMALWACSGEAESTESAYQVAVKDALGTPYTSGVVVKFM